MLILAFIALSFGLVYSAPVDETRRERSKRRFATEAVSEHCLKCICELESGCHPIGCHLDVDSAKCGYFQIKESYWKDCGRPGSSWHACADDINYASQCIQRYMKRHVPHYGCPMTCESFARVHKGGPRRCLSSDTDDFCKSRKEQPECSNL